MGKRFCPQFYRLLHLCTPTRISWDSSQQFLNYINLQSAKWRTFFNFHCILFSFFSLDFTPFYHLFCQIVLWPIDHKLILYLIFYSCLHFSCMSKKAPWLMLTSMFKGPLNFKTYLWLCCSANARQLFYPLSCNIAVLKHIE